jgi:nucleoside 2-deoxyribosyltransferase
LTKQKIARAAAKDELVRLNDALQKPYILIGGLAVQQYVLTRSSVDIDLVCDFDAARGILQKLYPMKDWYVKDVNDDDYRPTYVIQHRHKPQGQIIFGPKVTERGGYANLDWDELAEEATPFLHGPNKLDRVLVPPAHALAYSKLISVIGRSDSKPDKIQQDLRDFADLTNSPSFSLSRFWDILRKNDETGSIKEQFRVRISRHPHCLDDCCLLAISEMFLPSTPSSGANGGTKSPAISVYLAGPHRNEAKNRSIADALQSHGCSVSVPFELVANNALTNGSAEQATAIREVCMRAIDAASVVAVDLDSYGLDTAWEIGYAEGRGKRIVGFNLSLELTSSPRAINRRPYSENFMHGWSGQSVFDGIGSADQIAEHYKGKRIYVCGSFSNRAVEQLQRSRLQSDSRLLMPKQLVKAKQTLPKNYPLKEREATNQHLFSADVVLVVLPRYGMDASWQIGYATALGKVIIGIRLKDDGKDMISQSFWDHWMHGWKSKTHVTSLPDLAIFFRGLSATQPGAA